MGSIFAMAPFSEGCDEDEDCAGDDGLVLNASLGIPNENLGNEGDDGFTTAFFSETCGVGDGFALGAGDDDDDGDDFFIGSLIAGFATATAGFLATTGAAFNGGDGLEVGFFVAIAVEEEEEEEEVVRATGLAIG